MLKRTPQLQLGKPFVDPAIRDNWELNRLNPELYPLKDLVTLKCVTCKASTYMTFEGKEFAFECPRCLLL